MKRIGVEIADDSRWMWCKDSWWYEGVTTEDAPAKAEFHIVPPGLQGRPAQVRRICFFKLSTVCISYLLYV